MSVEPKQSTAEKEVPMRGVGCCLKLRLGSRARRFAAAMLLASAAVLHPPSNARASIFGEETLVLGAILKEEIAQVAQMVQTVMNLETQVRQLTTVINQGDILLSTFKSPQGMLASLRYAQNMLRREATLQQNMRHLKFRLETIDKERQEVFPEMGAVKTEDIPKKARAWNAALKESSEAAMRAQTSVDSIQKRLDYSNELQQHSDETRGVVGQLQLVNKSLGLLHTDLAAIESNLAHGQRVTATMAGVQAAETERAEEEKRRLMENYTEVGPPPRVLERLP